MSADNIIELPDTMRRQWRVISGDVKRYLLNDLGVSELDADRLLNAIEPLYLKWAAPTSISLGEDPVQAVNRYVRSLTLGLLQEIVLREIELIRAGLRG